MKRINLIGNKYGRLTVVSFEGIHNRHTHWNCECECGNKTIVTSCNLVKGNTLSCGCLHKEKTKMINRTHGLSKHRIYRVWRAMINRCEDKNNIMFHRYGARGIKVCDEWHKFENFIKDMGIPGEHIDIDRIDNDQGYFKSNCRWVTRSKNSRNTSKTIMVMWNGKDVPLVALAEEYGLHYKCAYKRYRSGWTIDEIVSIPSGGKREERKRCSHATPGGMSD